MASGELEVLRCESSLWSGHCCARCRAELGRIANRGANCRACRERICMSCREYSTATNAPEWLCTRCHKEKIETMEPTSEWIVDFLTPDNMKYQKNETKLNRSLTFKDPSPWSAVRGSPELRAYSSMPRGSTPWSQRNPSRCRQVPATTGVPEPKHKPCATVHLVDTCGGVIDLEPGSLTVPAAATETEETDSVDGPTAKSDRGPDGVSSSQRLQNTTESAKIPEDLKQIPPGVTPPRSRRFLRRDQEDNLLSLSSCGGSGRVKEDYRLVFLNGVDWSSDDGGGRHTSSSLSADDDCDWDYFMASADDDNNQQQRPSTGGAGTGSSNDISGRSSGGGGNGGDQFTDSRGDGSKLSETDAHTTFVPVVLPFPVFVPVPILIPQERAQSTLTAAFANVLSEYFRDRDSRCIEHHGHSSNVINCRTEDDGCGDQMPEPTVADERVPLAMYATRAATLDAKPSSAVTPVIVDDMDDDGRKFPGGYYSTSDDSDDSDAHAAMSYDVNDSPDDSQDDEDDECNVKLSSILDTAGTVKSNGTTSDEFSGTESMERIPVDESSIGNGKYTSLVMITQNDKPSVNVVANDTTKVMECDDVDCQVEEYKLTLDTSEPADDSEVKVVTGSETLSAVIALEEGLADDDSWVEDLDRDDFKNESSECEEMSFEEEPEYKRSELDFTLHTIVEESCEESEVEPERSNPTELEKYFFFGLCGEKEHDTRYTDGFSETSSIISEGLESLESIEPQQTGTEMIGSRLERYFLSEFMGFDRPDSDGSVGSDSPEHSPEQRRKRLVRARGTGRQHSSLDNLTESEQPVDVQLDYEDSSSDSDSHDDTVLFDKSDGQFDTVKRGKKKKRSVVTVPSLEALETEENVEKPGEHVVVMSDEKTENVDVAEEQIAASTPVETPQKLSGVDGLTRTDSFNNWSSDEETNLMMSKMRAFFKTMLANQPKPEVPGEKNKPPQLVKFESELTRLMKTVPGIRDEQVKEIVEYLSSEDTWSDSYDSSDYTSSDLETGSRLQDENRDTAFVYQKLMASLRRIDVPSSDSSASRNSPPLVTKVMTHIGSRLVALMHAVSESPGTPRASRYHRRSHHHHKASIISTTTEEEDEGEEEFEPPLPRSKSHDPLLEEARQEASDNERFSWRGSFESTLMMSDSRTRLTSSGESCVTLAAKRRSAGDLLIKSANSSREQLDRVRSCGSIGGSVEDRIWRNGRRRDSVPDSGDSAADSDDATAAAAAGAPSGHHNKSTTLPRSLQQQPSVTSSSTNSLPRLPTTPLPSPSPLTGIYKAHSMHQFNVKSARYRPPGYKNMATPPRREYNRRRQTAAQPAGQSPPSTVPYSNNFPPSPLIGTFENDSTQIVGGSCGVISPEPSANNSVCSFKAEDDVEKPQHRSSSSLGVARSDSMASVYSGAGEVRYGTVAVRGEVEFGLQYNYKAAQFEINIKHCRDLAAADPKRNRSDPYVKVYLLPDKSKAGKRKTRVKKHTMNPIFDEVLKYNLSLEELNSRTLWLSVWHSDMFGRNNFLGEVRVPLENKIFDDPTPKLYPLQERTEPLEDMCVSSKGEIIVGLKCVPPDPNSKKRTKGTLLLLVKDAKNLQAVKSNGTSDPFCKSYLLPDKGRNSKQKTNVARKTCNPSWNQTITYRDISPEELAERSLELTVWDHDRLGSNEFLGGVRLSLGSGMYDGKSVEMDSNEKEVALWQRMLDRPNFWVEGCLSLRPSLEHASKN